jgi:hypothetical protein
VVKSAWPYIVAIVKQKVAEALKIPAGAESMTDPTAKALSQRVAVHGEGWSAAPTIRPHQHHGGRPSVGHRVTGTRERGVQGQHLEKGRLAPMTPPGNHEL